MIRFLLSESLHRPLQANLRILCTKIKEEYKIDPVQKYFCVFCDKDKTLSFYLD